MSNAKLHRAKNAKNDEFYTRLEDIEKALNVKVLVCDHTGEDLVDIINKACQEEK